jgi:predicted aspartyl protease
MGTLPPSHNFPLDPSKPIIPVDVLLEGPRGRQLIRMALDTGATYTMAPARAVRAIGYDPALSEDRVEFIAAGSIEYTPRVTIAAAHAFGVRVSQLEIVCHDLPPQSPVRGLLGLNFLKHVSLHRDFPHRSLRITRAP